MAAPKGMKSLAGMLLLLVTVAIAVVSAPARAASVTDARIGEHGLVTRFVLDLSGAVDYHVFTLSDPYRVVIDFPDIDWRLDDSMIPVASGLIGTFRFGRFRPGTSRVVLDVVGPVTVVDTFVLPPQDSLSHRFVLDLVATDASTYQVTAGPPPQAAAAVVPVPRMKPRFPSKRVVVVDAGHGGVDPGAIGVDGTREKDLVLAMAQELRAVLEATGRYTVFLTRDNDTYLPLRDRVAVARRAGGELFISLHADSHPSRTTRGLSVYTLSETASDSEAAALAEKENKSDIIAGVDLSIEDVEVANILIDLAQRETMNQSVLFAGDLVQRLGQRVSLLNRTHRFAGFAVLKAPDIPSVLMELGYLSNRDEERILLDPAHRARIAEGVREAIDDYFDTRDRLARS